MTTPMSVEAWRKYLGYTLLEVDGKQYVLFTHDSALAQSIRWRQERVGSYGNDAFSIVILELGALGRINSIACTAPVSDEEVPESTKPTFTYHTDEEQNQMVIQWDATRKQWRLRDPSEVTRVSTDARFMFS